MNATTDDGIRSLQEHLAKMDRQRSLLERRLDVLMQVEAADPEGMGAGDEPDAAPHDLIDGIYVGERPTSAQARIQAYRRVVAECTGRSILRGAAPLTAGFYTGQDSLNLAHLYIELDTEVLAPASVIDDALKAVLRGGGALVPPPVVTLWGDEDMARDQIRPLTAMESLILRSNAVLLGGPGAGKTTFVDQVANALARRDSSRLGHWPIAMRECLPILVRLGNLAAWLSATGAGHVAGEDLLWAYVGHDLRERNLGWVEEDLLGSVKAGQFLLLLDGLDEVPPGVIGPVRESIEDFAGRYSRGRFLVTSRIATYQTPDYRLDKARWSVARLAPFGAAQVDRFIERWYGESVVADAVGAALADEKSHQLRQAVQRPEWGGLVGNPMLLTIIALVHTHQGELPASRAQLYEQAIGILLWHWEQHRRPSDAHLTALLRSADRDRIDLVMLLERLTFEGLVGDRGEGPGHDDPELGGAISEEALTKAVRGLHPDRYVDWAQDLVETLKRHSGLLVETSPGSLRLLHQSFAEYLAGAALAHEAGYPARAASLFDRSGAWREVILHSVGFLAHHQREIGRALMLVERLCPAQAPTTDLEWRRVSISGEVLLEIGPGRVHDFPGGGRLLEQVRHRLAALVEGGVLSVGERSAAGEALGRLGDPRFEPSGLRLPAYFRGEREKAVGLIGVPEGDFVMGCQQGDSVAEPDESGNTGRVMIGYRYWVARYQVTVAEFEAFVEASGYEEPEWWTDSGRAWLADHERIAPKRWETQRRFANRPVAGVTWFEATAYAAWLQAQFRYRSAHLPGQYVLRLPTEAEWERAARGVSGRRYAWGERWDDGAANAQETVGHATTVGMYPRGATPKGIMDMTGNLFEWCLTGFKPYPYDGADGRNDVDHPGPRVARGGSWLRDAHRARASCRRSCEPNLSSADIGFRLVLARSNDPT